MRRTRRIIAPILILLAAGALALPSRAAEANVTFKKRPTVTRVGDGARIDFAVSRTTDVAVFVQNAKGGIVRHLVAGVLGKNPPPPLRPNSLRQSITWDGKNNHGKKATGGPFKVRVALGLRPAFKKLIGQNPSDLGSIRGMAPAPDGKLYVFHTYGAHHPHDGTTAIAVFSREGKYLRTIAPFPANIPEKKIKGLRHLTLKNGSRVPFVHQFETRSCIPGLGDLPRQRPVVTRDGRLAFVGIQEGPRCFAQPGEARLTVIHTDGGVPAGGVLRTLIHPLTDTGASLALSPDEKTLYATGVRAGIHPCGPGAKFVCDNCDHGGATWNHTIPLGVVFKFGWNDAQGIMFLGDRGQRHRGRPKLKEPVSVATDKEGNVYVADLADDRIVVCKPDGNKLGEIKVQKPLRVEVHRRTGAVYVLAGEREMELIKFDGYQRGREVARLKLGTSRRAPLPIRRPLIALDDWREPTLIWVSFPFLRIEDRGNSFGTSINLRDPERLGPSAMASVMEMSADRVHNFLYVNNTRRYDLATGRYITFRTVPGRMWPNSSPGSASGSAGRDGNYYVHHGARRAAVYRYNPDMTLRPFPLATDREGQGRLRGYARNRSRGHTADHRGYVYVLWKTLGKLSVPGDAHRAHVLSVYDSFGRLVNARVVSAQIPSVSSVRVDYAGNIYLAVGVRPGQERFPAELAGQVRGTALDPDCVNGVNSYPMIYGSVIKFSARGGEIRSNIGGVPCNYAYGTPIQVSGAEWIISGLSVASSWSTPKRTRGTTIVCLCESPCIDVDGFGRSFFPDAGRARVGVLDTAGNLICTFGAYGNPDSAGPGSLIPTPAIPLWWPQAVAVDDSAAYVGDRLNRRIVCVDLSYQAEALCEITGATP